MVAYTTILLSPLLSVLGGLGKEDILGYIANSNHHRWVENDREDEELRD